MQKALVLIFFVLFAFPSFNAIASAPKESEKVVYVYISSSKSAKCFHTSPKCHSLRKSRKIVKVPLADAQKSKKACQHCFYKKQVHLPKPPKRHVLEEPIR